MDKIFNIATITKRCQLPISSISSNISDIILTHLKSKYEGSCINEGYIQKESIQILTHSLGLCRENHIYYDVTFQCSLCLPYPKQILQCTVNNSTKAGIKASISQHDNPILVFLPRDLHLNHDEFHNLQINDIIYIKVIGVRYELNDKYVSVIAEYIKKNN